MRVKKKPFEDQSIELVEYNIRNQIRGVSEVLGFEAELFKVWES